MVFFVLDVVRRWWKTVAAVTFMVVVWVVDVATLAHYYTTGYGYGWELFVAGAVFFMPVLVVLVVPCSCRNVVRVWFVYVITWGDDYCAPALDVLFDVHVRHLAEAVDTTYLIDEFDVTAYVYWFVQSAVMVALVGVVCDEATARRDENQDDEEDENFTVRVMPPHRDTVDVCEIAVTAPTTYIVEVEE